MITIFADYRMSTDEVTTLFNKYMKIRNKVSVFKNNNARKNKIIEKAFFNTYIAYESNQGVLFLEEIAYFWRGYRSFNVYVTKLVRWYFEVETINKKQIIKAIWRDDKKSYVYSDCKIHGDLHENPQLTLVSNNAISNISNNDNANNNASNNDNKNNNINILSQTNDFGGSLQLEKLVSKLDSTLSKTSKLSSILSKFDASTLLSDRRAEKITDEIYNLTSKVKKIDLKVEESIPEIERMISKFERINKRLKQIISNLK